jgi:hypothetical protein
LAPTVHVRFIRLLLACGAAAGPVYVLVGLIQVLMREGFDVRRHALSLLSNGDFGWIQTTNFLVSGALVLTGALGIRRALAPGRAGTWGPILLALYGVGLIGAGVYPADPGRGFPPGTPETATAISTAGLLHFVFGGIGFYALIAACFVFARRFASRGERGWAIYSVSSGVGFFVTFAAIASGATSPAALLAFYAAVVWIWGWHSALSRRVLNAGTVHLSTGG